MSDPALVTALLSIDPSGLGGVWVRARHGAQRAIILETLNSSRMATPQLRPGMDPVAVFGGVDLTASLANGELVHSEGVMHDRCFVQIAQAERISPAFASQLAARLDALDGSAVALLDEGTEDDGLPPEALRDRVAFFLHEGSESGDFAVFDPAPLEDVIVSESLMADAVMIAARLGIGGLRPVLQTVAAARAHAALHGRLETDEVDLAVAARLVLAHRAVPPAEENVRQEEANKPEPGEGDSKKNSNSVETMQDVIIEAAQTALPKGVVAALALRSKLASGTGEGLSRLSDTHGRPLPARAGRLDGRRRLDLLATLQAAAPWQALRGRDGATLKLHPDDIRLKRYRDRSERLLIFAVDASGSAAMARLAEAKGAAELLLADAYEHRDKVCLTVFRDHGAEVIVPPTRSLTRAKRLLSALPAGGATPLAAGLVLARELAESARRAGQAPQVILMTDGRANRALDGSTDRRTADNDASRCADQLRAARVPVVILDSGRRRTRHVSDLAGHLGADVVPLPRLGDALNEGRVDA